jgi:hypothetical protein
VIGALSVYYAGGIRLAQGIEKEVWGMMGRGIVNRQGLKPLPESQEARSRGSSKLSKDVRSLLSRLGFLRPTFIDLNF